MFIIYIFFIAISLSIDTFSLSLNISNIIKKSFIYSVSVGLTHFILTIIGYLIGSYLKLLLHNMELLSALVFFYIAISMIIEKEEKVLYLSKIELLFVIISISIDSLAIGITINSRIILSSLIIALVSFSLTYLGLIISKYLNKKLGKKISIPSIVILIIIGFLHLHKFIKLFV